MERTRLWGAGMGPKRLVALGSVMGMLGFASSAQAAAQWSSGPIERSYIQNCISYSFPQPIIEEGAWTWTSQYVDPNNPPDVSVNPFNPQPNEIFYVSVVAGAVGNACAGQHAHFELMGTGYHLPGGGGMYTASVPGYPIYCYAINWNNNPPTAQQEPSWPAGACPTGPQPGAFYSDTASYDAATNPSNAADTDPWPLPQG